MALHFILEAYKHLKAISFAGEAKELLSLLRLEEDAGLLEVSDSTSFKPFFHAIAQHRVWDREAKAKAVPA